MIGSCWNRRFGILPRSRVSQRKISCDREYSKSDDQKRNESCSVSFGRRLRLVFSPARNWPGEGCLVCPHIIGGRRVCFKSFVWGRVHSRLPHFTLVSQVGKHRAFRDASLIGAESGMLCKRDGPNTILARIPVRHGGFRPPRVETCAAPARIVCETDRRARGTFVAFHTQRLEEGAQSCQDEQRFPQSFLSFC